MQQSQPKCLKCGECCRNLTEPDGEYLIDGIKIIIKNGVCNHLNLKTNLCKIYKNRPNQCKIYFCDKAKGLNSSGT